jgi:hypothetical protein
MKNKLIGKKVDIIDKESIYYKHWGFIRGFDGDVYHINGGSISLNNGDLTPIFDRNQFSVRRRQEGDNNEV